VKNTAKWLAAAAGITFVIAWSVIGLKLLNNDYQISTEAYIGLAALILYFAFIMYIKFTNRCPHCKKLKQSIGKYCPHCGKELN